MIVVEIGIMAIIPDALSFGIYQADEVILNLILTVLG
jgi:hypothetical protein